LPPARRRRGQQDRRRLRLAHLPEQLDRADALRLHRLVVVGGELQRLAVGPFVPRAEGDLGVAGPGQEGRQLRQDAGDLSPGERFLDARVQRGPLRVARRSLE
jgi:hypothetical protein